MPRTDPQTHLNARTLPSPGTFLPRAQASCASRGHGPGCPSAQPSLSALSLRHLGSVANTRDRTLLPWGARPAPLGGLREPSGGHSLCDRTPPQGPGDTMLGSSCLFPDRLMAIGSFSSPSREAPFAPAPRPCTAEHVAPCVPGERLSQPAGASGKGAGVGGE